MYDMVCYVCMHPICYGLADIQRCVGVSWLKDGGSMHPAEGRTMWRKGKMIRLRQEKASMFGADRVRARVDDTQLRGRQCPHSPRLQSPFPGHREARGVPLGCSAVFSLAGARCRGPGENQGGATGRERCIQI